MEEAERLSTSRRTKKKQGKERVERIYYFGFIAKQNFGWLGRLGYFFFFFQLERCIVSDIW